MISWHPFTETKLVKELLLQPRLMAHHPPRPPTADGHTTKYRIDPADTLNFSMLSKILGRLWNLTLAALQLLAEAIHRQPLP